MAPLSPQPQSQSLEERLKQLEQEVRELRKQNVQKGVQAPTDLLTIYRYLSEAYAGYHFNKLSGINVDVGLFFSYIGLFSYTQFENWGYQASFTSDNTPWFFNGARLQIFPTDRFKVELWVINGWQTYGKFNELPGIGYPLRERDQLVCTAGQRAYKARQHDRQAAARQTKRRASQWPSGLQLGGRPCLGTQARPQRHSEAVLGYAKVEASSTNRTCVVPHVRRE